MAMGEMERDEEVEGTVKVETVGAVVSGVPVNVAVTDALAVTSETVQVVAVVAVVEVQPDQLLKV